MESLLKCKGKLIEVYSKYDIYINSIGKFLFSMIMLFIISGEFGTNSLLGNPGVILIVALICMFLPKIGITYAIAVYAIACVYSSSMEYAIVIIFVMLLVILLYMQFSPEYGYMIILSAAACTFNLPVMAIVLTGLFIGPAAIVPIVCGFVIYYILSVFPAYMVEVNGAYLESGVEKFKYIADNALLNREMLLAVVAGVIIITVVYFIKRSRINHSWKVATVAGIILNLLIMLVGGAVADASVDVVRLLIGTIISIVVCFVVIFFVRNLDFKKIERVQFEDDEYYYYVKAIPKKTVTSESPVKRRMVRENFDERDA